MHNRRLQNKFQGRYVSVIGWSLHGLAGLLGLVYRLWPVMGIFWLLHQIQSNFQMMIQNDLIIPKALFV